MTGFEAAVKSASTVFPVTFLPMGKSIFIISGEESGDMHGAALMEALKKLDPGIKVGGMGGRKMKEAGLIGLDSRELSVVGIVEVLEKLPGILRAFKELKRRLAGERPDAVVLIDFPDFNLKFAAFAKKLGIPVIYYISPQVWAWRKGRIKKIARLVDKMLVVFPFEAPLYEKEGVDVEYVGHPLADSVQCGLTQKEARSELGIPEKGIAIALLPGSRTGEVKRILGPMLKAGELVEKGLNERIKFILPAAESIDPPLIEGYLKGSNLDVTVVRGKTYKALRAADAAVVASGTATLETALIGTPMVIVYRVSYISYGIGKIVLGNINIGLPNIVAGRKVVPELIQNGMNPANIAGTVISILRDNGKREAMLKGFVEIRGSLGTVGASKKAASVIMGVIGATAAKTSSSQPLQNKL